MSKLKISENQFLGKQELNRLQKYLVEEGYKLALSQMVFSYGVVKLSSDATFQNLKIVPGTVAGSLTLKSGIAIDGDWNFISVKSDEIDVINSPNDNTLRYIKIKYNYTHLEEGTFDIAANGQLTGTNTKALEILRGNKNHPVKIKFPNSAVNTGEYTVLSVNSDTNVTIQGAAFTNELGQKFQVVGTFDTPVIPAGNKNIYEIDSYELTIDTNPNLLTNEYLLATVTTNLGVDTIVDQRETNLFSLASGSDGATVSLTNPLIGVESIKYEGINAPKSNNLVKIGWGYRVNMGDWSLDTTNNKLTIVTGIGGVFANNGDFTNGDFDGWRVFIKNNGKYTKIKTSTKPISDIELTLESTSGVDITSEIVVVPTADFIDIKVVNIRQTGYRVESFPVALGEGFLYLEAGATSNVKFRNVFRDFSTPLMDINDGSYLNETSFSPTGIQTGTNTTAYTGGNITPVLSVENHESAKAGRNQQNTFTEINRFSKSVAFNYGGSIDLTLSAAPDNNPVYDVAFPNDGNFFRMRDTTPHGEVHFMRDNNLSHTSWVNIEIFQANLVLKHNATPTAQETAAGYLPFFNHGGLDVNLFAGDTITLVKYNNSTVWFLANIWRKDGALDSSQANLFPITGLDPKCFSFVDNKLGTILQEIITMICNMSTGNQYAFHANKTVAQFATISTTNKRNQIVFDDDFTAPFFDNGNDMYGNEYVAPTGGIVQKFIAEGIKFINTAGVTRNITLEIRKNNSTTLVSESISIPVGTTILPSIITTYQTLDAGDRISVDITSTDAGSTDLEITEGRFSNSF